MKELAELTVWTIGHSTRPWEAFLDLLQANRIDCVADVRSFPGSRKFPHFNAETMAQNLRRNGLGYLPIPEVGGRRKPRPDSPNNAWRNAAFRAYADHMASEEYQIGRSRLIQAASRSRTVLLCSEAVWWRCHRALIADDLKASGATVLHILSRSKTVEHPYTSAAKISDSRLCYHE